MTAEHDRRAPGRLRRMPIASMGPTTRRLLVSAAVLLVVVAGYLASLPLDSGDNYCGNAFVKRTTQGEFNGCNGRLGAQRLLVAEIVLVAAATTLVLWGQRTRRRHQ